MSAAANETIRLARPDQAQPVRPPPASDGFLVQPGRGEGSALRTEAIMTAIRAHDVRRRGLISLQRPNRYLIGALRAYGLLARRPWP